MHSFSSIQGYQRRLINTQSDIAAYVLFLEHHKEKVALGPSLKLTDHVFVIFVIILHCLATWGKSANKVA